MTFNIWVQALLLILYSVVKCVIAVTTVRQIGGFRKLDLIYVLLNKLSSLNDRGVTLKELDVKLIRI
jgi:hypothetical protein